MSSVAAVVISALKVMFMFMGICLLQEYFKRNATFVVCRWLNLDFSVSDRIRLLHCNYIITLQHISINDNLEWF